MPRLTTLLDHLRFSKKTKPTIPASFTIPLSAPLAPIPTFEELFEKYQLPRLREQIAASRGLPEVTANGNLICAATSIDCEHFQAQSQKQEQDQVQGHPAPLGSNPVWVRAEETEEEEVVGIQDEDEEWVHYRVKLVETEEGVVEVVLELVEGGEEKSKERH